MCNNGGARPPAVALVGRRGVEALFASALALALAVALALEVRHVGAEVGDSVGAEVGDSVVAEVDARVGL